MTWSAQDFDMMTNGVKALENLSMPSSPLEYGEVASLLHPLIEAVNRLADNVVKRFKGGIELRHNGYMLFLR